MEVLLGKTANHFAVRFERFASMRPMTVLRITRPHLLHYDEFTATATDPIEIDMLDDVQDLARSETLVQLDRQRRGEIFHVEFDVLDTNKQLLERWRLEECRIIDCQFDELNTGGGRLYIHLRVLPKRVYANIGTEMSLLCEMESSVIC